MAMRTAETNIHRKAPTRLRSAKRQLAGLNCHFVLLFDDAACWRRMIRRAIRMRGSSLPIRPGSAISANFIARLIKGCRGDVGCRVIAFAK